MFETIMDLPLFKGVSKAHVESFVEKTHIDFRKIPAGEEFISPYTTCKELTFILSGEAVITYDSENAPTISQICGPGSVLGAYRLFGLFHDYGFHAVAGTEVGVMSFDKDQYVNMLQSEHIYLLNVMNYLSVKNQRIINAMLSPNKSPLLQAIALRVLILTEVTSRNIIMKASLPTWRSLTNLNDMELAAQFEKLAKSELIRFDQDAIRIPNRKAFLDFAFD